MPTLREFYDNEYLGEWSAVDGDLTLTIKDIWQGTFEPIPGVTLNKTTERKPVFAFEETNLKFACNKTNTKILRTLYGDDYRGYIGKKITLTRRKARNGKMGLAIIEKVPEASNGIICEGCKKVIPPSNGMTDAQVAEYTKKKYGKCLCANCAKKVNEAKGEE